MGRMDGKLMPPSYAVPALKGILTPAFREHLQITYWRGRRTTGKADGKDQRVGDDEEAGRSEEKAER